MALRSTQPLTEKSTRDLPGGKGRLEHKANPTQSVSQLSRKYGSLDASQPYGPPRPVTGMASSYTSTVNPHPPQWLGSSRMMC
jgi:hypothetical protein